MNSFIKKILGINNVVNLKTYKRFKDDDTLKILLSHNSEIKNKYEGARCFIMGNGPSLKNVDFKLLRNEYVFTVNQLTRNPRFEELNTNFHMWADERFFNIDESKPEDLELLETMKKVKSNDNIPVVFYKYAAFPMIKKYKLDEILDIRYYEETGYEKDEIFKTKIDFTKLVPGFGTVVHYAICLAMYMGFKEIVLLGCDCSGFISTAEARLGKAEKAVYAYKISENEKKRMEKVQALSSMRDELFWHVCLLDDYERLDKYCKKNGVKLYNATNPTLLEGIMRIDLKDYLASKK